MALALVVALSNAAVRAQSKAEIAVDSAFEIFDQMRERGRARDLSRGLMALARLELEHYPESRFDRLRPLFAGTFQEQICAASLASQLATEGAQVPPMERYLELLHDEDSAVRRCACLILVRRTDWSAAVEAEVLHLFEAPTEAPYALIALLRTNRQSDQIREIVGRSWESTEPTIRDAAIVLCGFGRPSLSDARQRLESVLTEERAESRQLALCSLLMLGAEEGSSLPTLLKHAPVGDPTEYWLSREAALLLHRDDPSVAEALVRDLSDPDLHADNLSYALGCLARIDRIPAEADPALLALLASKDKKTQGVACIAAQSRLAQSPELKKAVVVLLADSDVRTSAALALGWGSTGEEDRAAAGKLNQVFNAIGKDVEKPENSLTKRDLEWKQFLVAAALARVNPKAHKTGPVLVEGLPRRRPPVIRYDPFSRIPAEVTQVIPLLLQMLPSFPMPDDPYDHDSRAKILALEALASLERLPANTEETLVAMQSEEWPAPVAAEISRTLEVIRGR